MKSFRHFVFLMIVLASAANLLSAQQIQIDRGIRVNELWCFPLLTDSLTYLYLPDAGRLGTDEAGNTQFSLIRYVQNKAQEASDATITETGGGAVLHFLVLYDTPAEKVAGAEKALQEKLKNDEISLKGPVIFTQGRFGLVSSILNEQGEPSQQLLAMGEAPVLEGSRLALTFQLTPEKSKLLLESFKMATPDISIVFDMQFEGLTDAFQAQMTINWSEAKKSQSAKAGGSIYFVSAEVEAQIEEMIKNNAIRLTITGSDANMEALIQRVYDKAVNMLFEPMILEEVARAGGLEDAISALIDPQNGMLSSRNTTGFGLYAGFTYKDIKAEGSSVFHFDSRSAETRHHYITFNIGDFYRRYGDNPHHFREVNLDDPTFQQREVYVGVDGTLMQEFSQMVNSVTVKLRKAHQSGDTTIRELILQKNNYNPQTPLRLVYGSRQDTDRATWLGYEYKTIWQFMGLEGSYTSDWQTQDAAMINLYVPYERHAIQLIGNMEQLSSRGVKAVVVAISYDFFGSPRQQQNIIRSGEVLEDKTFHIIMPLNAFQYDYHITWVMSNGERVTRSDKDNLGILFIDDIPHSE